LHTDSIPSQPAGWRVEIVDNNTWNPQLELVLDELNLPHIAYYPPGEVRYAYRLEDGRWESDILDTSNVGGASISLAFGDEPWIVYEDTNPLQLVSLHQNSTGWHKEIIDSYAGFFQPSAKIDSNGTVQIAYASEPAWAPTPRWLKYAKIENSSVQTLPLFEIGKKEYLTPPYVSLSKDRSPTPNIAFYDSNDGKLKHVFWKPNGWESDDVVGGHRGWQPSIALARTGGVGVAFYDGFSSSLAFASLGNKSWRIEQVDPRPRAGINPSLKFDSGGKPMIAYLNAQTKDVLLASRENGTWTIETVYDDDGLSVAWPSLDVDRCGNPHVAFYVFTDRSLRYATKGPPCLRNRPPVANAGGSYTGHEGSLLTFTATATDPDNDSIVYRWDFDNDGMADTAWSSSPTATNTWSDDYTGEVRVEASDGKTTSNATATVTILNLPPKVDSVRASLIATANLRIAGEKWHDVCAYMNDGGNDTLLATLTRQPGKPQEASFDVGIDVAKNNSLRIVYTPDDDKVNGQPNGATPAWLTFTFDSGPPVEMHHTFNVKHPDTWNWTVSLNSLLAGRNITFTATATDLGSDDLTFTWEWGDGTPAIATTYFNDGIGPDPYPSPDGIYPFSATDSAQHIYSMAGDYSLTLTVLDDDGGMMNIVIVLVIP